MIFITFINTDSIGGIQDIFQIGGKIDDRRINDKMDVEEGYMADSGIDVHGISPLGLILLINNSRGLNVRHFVFNIFHYNNGGGNMSIFCPFYSGDLTILVAAMDFYYCNMDFYLDVVVHIHSGIQKTIDKIGIYNISDPISINDIRPSVGLDVGEISLTVSLRSVSSCW